MTLELRICAPEEIRAFIEAAEAAFGQGVDEDEVESFLRVMDVKRCVYMADGRDIVGTAAAYTFSMSIPGGDVPTAGISVVGVLPSHRRRGILTALMKQQLNDVHTRREPLAALWASEGGIYGRFGYGIATMQGGIDIDRDRAGFRDDPGAHGNTRLLRLEEAPKVLDPIYEQVRRTRAGMYSRSEDFWSTHTLNDHPNHRRGAGSLFCAVHETDEHPDAYAFYRVHQDWDGTPTSQLRVREALGIDAGATREIWRFLFGIDLIQRV
ncbi:MAG: GNAT family N-acetyltransferase [Actinomycetota bacterium]|nr:GNAT family N-acetyltransferase [Actinomycetota bacterium]